ncbi:MAG TPA: CHAT domain-containing tetratricopeptide repeat protein [Thermoanaerobaculia bacterium]|nr:CHAT domain-containing tetratricopeptide repeat protein [Thermoanaerobaculia bacterium]
MSRPPALGLLLALLAGTPALAQPPTLDQALDLHAAGRTDEALAAYRRIVAAGAPPEEAAVALGNACVIRMERGDYRDAQADCRQALVQSRKAGDPLGIAESLNNLGLITQALGGYAEAERHFREALALNRRHGAAEAEAINLSNLGTLALEAGRYSQALTFQTAAADLASRHPAEPWAAEQLRVARINRGVALEKVGDFREALGLYREILDSADSLDPYQRAALLVNSGVIYRNLGDPVRAVESFRAVIPLYRDLNDTAGLSNAHLNLGIALHRDLRRPAEAERAFREALRLAEASGDHAEEIQDLFYLGQLLSEQGRLDEAHGLFERCRAAAAASGSAEGKWSAHAGLGQVAEARGNLAAALAQYEKAVEEIEQVRAGLTRGERREGYFGDKRSVYAAAVRALAELDRREPGKGHDGRALGVVQRAKARDLLDALGGARESRKQAVPLGADDLRARIQDGGAVLEYFVGEPDLYLWIVRRSEVRLVNLGPREPILAAVAEVHRGLSRGEGASAKAVAGLSEALLRRAAPLPRSGPLWIAPDGALRYLPFEILQTAGGEALVDRGPVTYLPSASTLAWLEDWHPDPDLRWIAFGDPRLQRRNGGSASPQGLLVERFGLAPLPATLQEIQEIRQRLGGEGLTFTGEQATEKAFREAAPRGARVVHLATHAVIDERPGRGAAVLLSPADGDDGLLYPEEIAALDYRGDLTVLAACRTALGPGEDGQALTSLTGSFLAAGSLAVVATLWDVGDNATAVFMDQLYDQLAQGHPPAEALRRAKQRLRADPRWADPSLWAGYVLVGDGPPAVRRRPGWTLWAAGLAIVLGLGAALSAIRPALSRRS